MKLKEYTIKGMTAYMHLLRDTFDLVRLVAPESCHVLELGKGDRILFAPGGHCFDCWNRTDRCDNCTSSRALTTGERLEKVVMFAGVPYSVHSVPVCLRLDEDTAMDCVLELVSVHDAPIPVTFAHSDRQENLVQETADQALSRDAITGLDNWDRFCQRLRDLLELDPATPRVLISADINKFSLVNELFGLDKGNEILSRIGKIFRAHMEAGSLSTRRNADNFLICMPEEKYDAGLANGIAAEVNRLMASPFYSIHMQMGIYRMTDLNLPIPVMCDRANLAIRQIKGQSTRVACEFKENMLQAQLHEQKVLTAFQDNRDGHHFRIYLQPQTDAAGRLLGAEALVRWVRADGTILPPDSFIGILEESGSIAELDRRVWRAAASLLHDWQGLYEEDFAISVNVSPRDFFYMDVHQTLCGIVNDYRIDPGRLHVEIVESFLIDDQARCLDIVHRLHDDGFTIEIDDFGKGYSSLSYIQEMNADCLKVDKDFLRSTADRDKSRIILQSIIAMAHELGMACIAEGVETADQVAMLTQMGYKAFQGYYFSRPMPVDDFYADWLQKDRA